MKKIIPLMLSLLLCAVLFTGCGGKLAEGFDEQVITDTAEQLISQIHVNYDLEEVLTPVMREDYLKKYPMANMKEQVLELLSGSGEFIAFGKESIRGDKNPDNEEEDVAVILVTAGYEKAEINYTITFDKDMKVLSFYAQ